MGNNISVKKLQQVDSNQWFFEIESDSGYDATRVVKSYRTDEEGRGLFQELVNGGFRQITGTCQFGLRGCTRSAAYSRIKRYFS